MKLHFSRHALNQIEARSKGLIFDRDTGKATPLVEPVATQAEVLAKVAEHEKEILAGNSHVRVIVKTFKAVITTQDGKTPDQWSNGDHLVAVCDPSTCKIVTVMLQRQAQVDKARSAGTKYV